MNKKVAIIIVTYNRCIMLQECLEALFKQTYSSFEIILVDNHSSDGTSELASGIARSDSRLHYFRQDTNLGGAGGYCYGICQAEKLRCDYVWLMDDDAVCEARALEYLMTAGSQLKNWGFLSGKVLWTDWSLCKMNIPLFIKGTSGQLYSQVRKATFVSLLIPWKVIQHVGLPIKEFFIWGDDQEYTERISRLFPCFYIAQSVVVHHTAQNTGSDIVYDSLDRLDRYYYKYRNEWYISRRNGLISCLYYLFRLLRDTCHIVLTARNKLQRLRIMYQGFRQGLVFRPAIHYLSEKETESYVEQT
ncbi:MAG TPA: glycosyltransferase family 2 protein [Candidatus Blautia intestinavium]|nr:glycosyltransferase family 2 protein [Candidatus Blautia intestinavium]HJC56194.1 glycosyltransferase family 2 protein [Candidatus Eisenbergiella intestinipullorum]